MKSPHGDEILLTRDEILLRKMKSLLRSGFEVTPKDADRAFSGVMRLFG